MRLSILQKMLTFILLPAIIGLIAVTALNYNSADKALTNQINEELQLVLHGQKVELFNTVNLLASTMNNFALNADVIEFLRAKANNTGNENKELEQKIKESILYLVKNYGLLRDVGLVDKNGTVLIHSTESFIGNSIAERAYFKAAMKGEVAPVTIQSKANGRLSSAAGFPVKDGDNIIGVVYTTMALEKVAQTTTDTVQIAQTGKCFVYDKNGKLLMHPDKELVGAEDANQPWFQYMLSAATGHYEFKQNDVEMQAYFDRIPLADWLIIISVEKDDIFAPVRAMFMQSVLAAFLTMLIVGLIIVFVAKDIVSVLRNLAGFIEKIAHGELNLPKEEEEYLIRDGKRSDEIGIMARGTQEMLKGLRLLLNTEEAKAQAEEAAKQAALAMAQAQEQNKIAAAQRENMLAVAQELEHIVNIVSSASEELSAQVELSENGARDQADRVTTTATALEEMNATVLEIARNAGTTSDSASNVRSEASAGSESMQECVRAMVGVKEESLKLQTEMGVLSNHAEAIDEIMNVISDIADQTNLLALNAAIEAARAGEAGRGFAVVADEVRKLAEKTMTSTTDVGNAISAIQKSTADNTRLVAETVVKIEEVTDMVSKAGEALHGIVQLADTTADQVRAIAAASEEQSATSEEITHSVESINSIAKENANNMQEARKAVEEVVSQSHILSQLIEQLQASK